MVFGGFMMKSLCSMLLKKMADFQQPFFSLIFTLSSHPPYVVPPRYKGKFPQGTLGIHKSIGYADYAVKQFFETVKKEPWYKDTLFIITADHAYKSDQKKIPRYRWSLSYSDDFLSPQR